MKKNYFLLLAAAAIAALTGCKKDEPENPPTPGDKPAIEVGIQGNLSIPLEGGEATIPYTITNPVDGGTISAKPTETWIGNFNCDTPGEVKFIVEENTETSARSSIVTLTYTYGEGETVQAQVNVIQDAAIAYDYEYEFDVFSGIYYGDQFGVNGEHNYYTWISDIGFDESGYSQPGGVYYLFDIYAAAPADVNSPTLPAGTYTMGEPMATAEMTFTPDYSKAFQYTDAGDGSTVFSVTFTDGTVEISYEGDVMTLEAVVTDNEGKIHHVTYTGPGVFESDISQPDSGVDPLDRDLDFTATLGVASYLAEDAGVMEVQFSFTDMETDMEGYVIPPGNLLYVDMYMPYDESGELATGDYTIANPATGEAFSIYPGETIDFFGMLFTVGTYADYIDADGTTVEGLLTEGTMNITGGNGNYTITCDFRTADGYSVKCTYSGPLTIQGIPGPYSTLTEDYTLDLEGAAGIAYYYGDYYYTNGSNWMIKLNPTSGPDGLQAEIVSEGLDFGSGITSGTYKASASTSTIYPGEYLTGYMDGSYLYGTNFVGGFSADGYVTQFAPATSGDFIITNHGDGTYTFEFEFIDDKNNTWDGTWTGTLELTDAGYAPANSRANIPYRAQNEFTLEEKLNAVQENAFRIGEPVSVRQSVRKIVK